MTDSVREVRGGADSGSGCRQRTTDRKSTSGFEFLRVSRHLKHSNLRRRKCMFNYSAEQRCREGRSSRTIGANINYFPHRSDDKQLLYELHMTCSFLFNTFAGVLSANSTVCTVRDEYRYNRSIKTWTTRSPTCCQINDSNRRIGSSLRPSLPPSEHLNGGKIEFNSNSCGQRVVTCHESSLHLMECALNSLCGPFTPAGGEY